MPRNNGPGQPPKLTPSVQKNMVEALELGMTLTDATTLAGIAYSTHRNWMLKGEEAAQKQDKLSNDDRKYLKYLEAIKKAQVSLKQRALESIMKAAEGEELPATIIEVKQEDGKPVEQVKKIDKRFTKSWQAGAWLLERKFPDEFGKKDKVVIEKAVSSEMGVMLNALQEQLSQEEYERVLLILAAAGENHPQLSIETLTEATREQD